MRNFSASLFNENQALRISVNCFVSLRNFRCALMFFIVVAQFVPRFRQYFFIVQTTVGDSISLCTCFSFAQIIFL